MFGNQLLKEEGSSFVYWNAISQVIYDLVSQEEGSYLLLDFNFNSFGDTTNVDVYITSE